jgi:hypothetical protein
MKLAAIAVTLTVLGAQSLYATQARASDIGNAILAGIATHVIVGAIRNQTQPSPVYIPVVTHTGAYHPIVLAPNHDPRVYRPQQALPTVSRDVCSYNGQTVLVYDQQGRAIGYQICP